ncbi:MULTISPECIES: MetQ/NlpA family ABC transporter substrate-binding protein [Arthrobacter]|uniref:MetQ/NlpA family ABC transporter substrate-binding protein n=1 Tax=Arthrobacter TaxID=1663 RepID=UPI0008370A57|nr:MULTISPECIES: MetQ/NlpA family ABC transporter substrate-binding protein [Arthrobacter]UPO78150.1 MetQ/NlpA family ABC transporter substrate-binding protein [Arthrobacter sp. Helios]
MKLSRKILALAAAPLLALGMAACGSAAGDEGAPVKIGVVGASDPYWATYTEAAKAEGIDVEIVDFGEYTLPNPALSEGELDLNQFQHIVYLARYNVASGSDLTPVGSTAIYPLGLYSTQYDSVEEIPDGATVAIPNDESNLSRGLLVLQSAGLVTLEGGGSAFSTLDDIDAAKSKVKVTTLEASLTPTSLPDVAAAIINNDFVEDAGLKFEDAIAQDDPADPAAIPYVNIFAARAGEENNETYVKLVEIYQNTQSVQDGVQEASGNTAKFLKVPVEDLKTSLEKVQKDIEALG